MSPRERRMLLAALAVALLVGVPGLLTAPRGRSGPTLEEERTRRRRIQERIAEERADLEALENRLARRLDPGGRAALLPRMVEGAQAAAAAAGVRLADLKPMAEEDAGGILAVPVELTLRARFPEGARFLFELQQRARSFRVERLQMSAVDPATDELEIGVRLVGFVRGAARPGGGES